MKIKQTLTLEKDGIGTSIPASSFDRYDEPVTIDVIEQPRESNSLSGTYDFTIKQGTRTISQFEEGVTLTFNVNAERSKNPNNLKVFYFNEETNKWENVGGTYSDGKVTVVTYHFSRFTVFEAADDSEDLDEIVRIDDEVDTDEVDTDEVDTDEVDTDEVDTDEVDTDEVDTDEVDTDEVDTDEVDTDEVDTDEVDTDEVDTDEVDTDEVDTDEVDTDEVDTDEVDTDEVDTDEVDTDEVDTDEVDTDEVDTDEVDTDEVDTNEVDTDDGAQDQSSEKGSELPNTATKVFNLFLIGMLLIVVGVTVFFMKRKVYQ
ncbi:LPXTG cell wall anchor domain-containing protein [Bacillus sp. JCM 19034]|uniref:LPXTG cell wall anchor domain-containing protein n=1 Tax=Bacillus sp. JCM 19034 TaxID=1481928 RepID=UPI0007859760|nr:LPXTG cell wall anchor domain-containing protein [Bacillus sp. JCM 19034]